MNDKNIWGIICECGNEVCDYYNEHPWCDDENIIKIIKCDNCGKMHRISQKEAEEFYNNKIFNCFSGIYGNVLEIGCGGGLITQYVKTLKKVEKIVTVDIDDDSINEISDQHFKLDLNEFDDGIFNQKFDFVICRDVLMYLENIEYTFSKLSKISNKVVLLNWHDINHKNCLNKTYPLEIFKLLNKYYNNLKIEYPYFYKKGYLITSL